MNTPKIKHFKQVVMASFHHRTLSPFWLLTLAAGLILASCNHPKQIIDTPTPLGLADCEFISLEAISVTQQDALPGLHSNIRKQRTYRLELKVSGEEADQWVGILEQMSNWELWVDSVAVPVRFRPMQKEQHMLFSGMRSFYDLSHSGGMLLPVETYALHKAELNGRSRLVGYNALQCFAIELDTISSRPIIVYP
jgi:hypothetical protein